MTGNTGGIPSGTAVSPPSTNLPGKADNDVSCRRILGQGIKGFSGIDPRGPTVPDHFKCGGGCSGVPLGINVSGERGGPVEMGEGGAKLLLLTIHVHQLVSFDQTRVIAGGF